MNPENKQKIEEKELEREIDFVAVFKQTLKHWKWILVSVILFVLIGVLYILVTPSKYERTSQILIEDESKNRNVPSQLSALIGMGMIGSVSGFSIDNEIAKMKSPDVYREVINHLDLQTMVYKDEFFKDQFLYGKDCPVSIILPPLDDNDALLFDLAIDKDKVKLSNLKLNKDKFKDFNSPIVKLGESINTPVGPIIISKNKVYVPDKTGRLETSYDLKILHYGIVDAIAIMDKEVSIDLLKKQGNVVVIKVEDQSINKAVDIINQLTDVYNNKEINKRTKLASVTENFINERLKKVMAELGDVETDLSKYQSKTMMPDAQKAAELYMEENKEQERQILETTNKLELTRYIHQYLSNASYKNQVLPSNSVDQNSALEKQISDYNEMILERNRFAENSSDTHPKVLQINSEIEEMRNAILSSVNNTINSYETTLKGLKSAQNKALSKITKVPGQAMHLLELGREQKVKQEIYLYLLQKREENEISLISNSTHPEVILKPYGKMRPVAPRKVMILGICFVIGLFLPFGYNFCKEVLS